MFYFTRKIQKKFNMSYMTFNRYQYGQHFVFANQKTHCVFSSVREHYQKRATALTTVRIWDVVALSEL